MSDSKEQKAQKVITKMQKDLLKKYMKVLRSKNAISILMGK